MIRCLRSVRTEFVKLDDAYSQNHLKMLHVHLIGLYQCEHVHVHVHVSYRNRVKSTFQLFL